MPSKFSRKPGCLSSPQSAYPTEVRVSPEIELRVFRHREKKHQIGIWSERSRGFEKKGCETNPCFQTRQESSDSKADEGDHKPKKTTPLFSLKLVKEDSRVTSHRSSGNKESTEFNFIQEKKLWTISLFHFTTPPALRSVCLIAFRLGYGITIQKNPDTLQVVGTLE